ncbi:MAG: PAS domain S-box protein [Deltaproteobacteria bacterium]|nr:PAS domain S-box protein [Deltaproteobacteria bacterium]
MEKPFLPGDVSLAVMEAIPQGVTITVTATRTIVYANPAACAMFGYSKSEFEGRSLLDIHPFDVALIVADMFKDRSTGPFTSAPRIPCLRKDGTSFLADVSGARMVIDGTHCMVGFFVDRGQSEGEQVLRLGVGDALREHREIASKVFNTSPSAIAISRISDGVYLDVNPAFTEQTGYTRDEAVGKAGLPGGLGLWTTREDRQRLVRALEDNPSIARIEAQFRHKDGHLFYAVMHARSMVLNEPCLLTITNDVSDIKQAQMALFAEKERLAVTLHSIGDAVITTDTERRVRLMNAVAEQLTGWRQDESLGQPLECVFHTVHEITGQTCESPVAKVLASGAVVELGNNLALVARDGSRRPIADSAAPIRDAAGTILGAVLVFRDTTESRKAHALLRQSEEKFRTIIEQNTDGIALLDEFGTVIEWNPALARISGIPGDQAIGKPVWETDLLRQPAMAEDAQDATALREIFAGGLSRDDSPLFFRNQEVSATRDGEEVFLHRTIFPIKTERGFRLGCIIRDITQQKKASATLQKADKLQSLGVLAGGIAHDFNNLLGAIFGNIELACMASREAEVIRSLKASMATMGRARALTQQLLTFAKGGVPIKRVQPLFPFVRMAAEFALSGSNVACRFAVAPSLWSCDFDEHQIGQVVDNIVINAIQAMPRGGCLEISAENVVVADDESSSLLPGNYVRISFADQGPGIPSAISSRIFDPFFTTKPGGSGLGLSTCYSILRQHDGHISAASEPGRGSTFHVWLPAAEGAVLLDRRSSEHPQPGSGTVLVMDDDQAVRDTIRRVLEYLGYSCRTVPSGQEALREYRRFREEGGQWRAIICDLTIPGGMSGQVFVSELRKMDQEVPIIVSSGYAEDPILADPKRYGFDDSLPKPYTASQLAQALARNLQHVPTS